MPTIIWGFLAAVAAVYFFIAAMCRKAAMEMPMPEPKPKLEPVPDVFVAWRFTLDDEQNLATLAVYMHPETEKYLASDVWARLP